MLTGSCNAYSYYGRNRNVTKHGFLVREGDALERLSKVKKICFDKTGTLTYGSPEVTDIFAENCTEQELFALTAAAESYSEHPLGKAVVKCAKAKKLAIPHSENFSMKTGKGVQAVVEGKTVLSGNVKYLKENDIAVSDELLDCAQKYIDKGCTVIYTAVNGVTMGFLVLSDTVRNESRGMIASLKAMGVEPVLLTGDNEKSAKTIADSLGITEVKANCLPEDKLNTIAKLQKDGAVAMIGDGINDAPALKRSDVGIAMGGVGSDVAVDAADIALVDDEVKELPHLIAISKRMMTTIKINLAFSMTLNFVAIILAIAAVLNPVIGALVHNCGSVIVIVNSALLLKWRSKK